MERYNFLKVEKKWRNIKSALSVANKKSKLKFFIWIHGEDDSFSGINYIDEFMNTKKNIFNSFKSCSI